jgi:hypothetical protein
LGETKPPINEVYSWWEMELQVNCMNYSWTLGCYASNQLKPLLSICRLFCVDPACFCMIFWLWNNYCLPWIDSTHSTKNLLEFNIFFCKSAPKKFSQSQEPAYHHDLLYPFSMTPHLLWTCTRRNLCHDSLK